MAAYFLKMLNLIVLASLIYKQTTIEEAENNTTGISSAIAFKASINCLYKNKCLLDTLCGPNCTKVTPHQHFLIFILLVSGDVNTNPGPATVKYPCQICDKAVKLGQRGIACDGCDIWHHVDFMLMSTEVYEALANTSLEWIYYACGMPSFTSSLFLATISLSSNSYELLLSSQEPEPSILYTQGRVPISCSTPKMHTNTTEKSNTTPPKRSDKTKHVNKN